MFMPAPSISTVTTTARNIPTLTIYEDFDKIIAKEVCFTETGKAPSPLAYWAERGLLFSSPPKYFSSFFRVFIAQKFKLVNRDW